MSNVQDAFDEIDNKYNKDEVQYFHDGENKLEMHGYKKCVSRSTLTVLGYILTFGILRLVFHWYTHFRLYSTHTRCKLSEAEKILVIDRYKRKYETYFVENVKHITLESNIHNIRISYNLSNGSRKEEITIKTFTCKEVCYIWDTDYQKFFKLVGLNHSTQKSDFFKITGYNANTRTSRDIIYGSNKIDVPFQSISRLFVLEALTPFYIFQVFTLIVWFAEEYYYYTIAIVVMSMYGITSSVIQTRKNQQNLRGTVEMNDDVDVIFENKIETIKSTELVPGDIVVIPSNGCNMLCDAVLLNGTCIVNESMLTGESVPVLKTPIQESDRLYNEKDDENHTLYCGTTVIQARTQEQTMVKAVVIRTGFLTSKGELVRSIMYPPPADFKFERDSYKYIAILAGVALCGFIYTIVSKSTRHLAAWDTIIKALDIITIIIPPALPAAMTIGKLYALNRLKRKNIFCMNSRVINVSGSTNCVCFDKTGTLTEDGLDLYGVLPVELLDNEHVDPKELNENSDIIKAMATCHSLTLIKDVLSGDPLDLKMFQSTNFMFLHHEHNVIQTLVKPQNSDLELGIIHQHQFSSNLQRMSVVVNNLAYNKIEVYCKGSPEAILKLSTEKSVPSNTLATLKKYTEQGYRVLAIGAKILDNMPLEDVKKIPRENIESQLNFIGFLIFENKLKPESTEIINVLKDANIKVVMITGDNIQTAVCVAKECGILEKTARIINVEVTNIDKLEDPKLDFHPYESFFESDIEEHLYNSLDKINLTVTGQHWALIKQYFPEQIPKIVCMGTVFARMSSDQKQQLIVELQALGYYVAMCGDGTNDCGALKAAHVGISLSEADASVASPFTSKVQNISCVREVIKEGRAALVTSFGVFKFMICYSLTQFTSVIILYGIDANLTSLQFLFIDIFLALNIASLFGYTAAYDKVLYTKPPCTSLLSYVPILSIISHLFLVISFQVGSYYLIQTFDWFHHFVYDPEKWNYFASYENYAIFSISMFQYIIIAVTFSKGKPYRKNILTNHYLCASMTIMTLICVYMTLYPAQWILDVLIMIAPTDINAGLVILGLAFGNLILALIVEDVLVDWLFGTKVSPVLPRKEEPYLKILGMGCAGWLQPEKETVVNVEKTINKNGFYNEAYESHEL